MLYLALTLWPLGDIGRAVSLVGDAEARIAGLTHIGTRAYGKMHAAMFELMRGDLSRAARTPPNSRDLRASTICRLWRAFGVFLEGWATAESGAPAEGLEAMRRGAELLREQNVLVFDGLFKIALAEAEARAGDVDRAVAILDEALATCDRTGHRAFEAELHRVRGEMLLEARSRQSRRPPRKPSKPQSLSLSNRARAASACARRSRSPSSTNRPAAPPTPTPSSRPRSKASRRRRKCRRSPRRRRCSRRWRRRRKSSPQRRSGNGGAVAGRLWQRADRSARLWRAGNDGSVRAEPANRAYGEKDAPERLAADFGLWAGSYTRGELAVDEGACGGLPRRRRRRDPIRPRPASRIGSRASPTGSPANF